MKFSEKALAAWVLRIGLGFTNLYAGIFLILDPPRYYRYLPEWFLGALPPAISVDIFLRAQGVMELLVAFMLISWFLGKGWVRTATILYALEMSLIIVFIGVDPVTFRNVGLLAGAIALLFLVLKKEPASVPVKAGKTESPGQPSLQKPLSPPHAPLPPAVAQLPQQPAHQQQSPPQPLPQPQQPPASQTQSKRSKLLSPKFKKSQYSGKEISQTTAEELPARPTQLQQKSQAQQQTKSQPPRENSEQ